MKKQLFLFTVALLSAFCTFGQNKINLVIFSEDGDQFFAYVNGIRQNDKPETNVKITNLASPNISLRIEFNDKALPQLKQNMALESGYEHTAKIKRDMKKQLKLRYFGQVPIDEAPAASAATVEYHTAENSATTDNAPITDNHTITSTTTTTQTYSGINNGNGNVSIGMGGAGITMNVSGMDPNAGNVKTTTSTTVTSTKSSGSSSSDKYASQQEDHYSHRNHKNNAPQGTVKSGCGAATSAADFDKMKQSVKAKPFSDTKMSTAKVATKNACLSVTQIKELCKLFNMDDEKLAYAKFAYDYCSDKSNYYQVSDVFSFSGTTEEFNQFLENK